MKHAQTETKNVSAHVVKEKACVNVKTVRHVAIKKDIHNFEDNDDSLLFYFKIKPNI